MGMYTEFHLNVELKKDTPKDVIDVLKFMTASGAKTAPAPQTPAHPLFTEGGRWIHMLWCGSYYFPMRVNSVLEFDTLAGAHFLSVRCNLKNYEQEIQKFVDWLTPFFAEEDGVCIGYRRYEENDDPTLLYHPNRWVEIARRGGAS